MAVAVVGLPAVSLQPEGAASPVKGKKVGAGVSGWNLLTWSVGINVPLASRLSFPSTHVLTRGEVVVGRGLGVDEGFEGGDSTAA